MKNLYSYSPVFNDNDELLWRVFEISSQQYVAEFFFEEDAQELCEFLQRGGGFAGFTPSFMLRKSYAKDINQAFSMEFS